MTTATQTETEHEHKHGTCGSEACGTTGCGTPKPEMTAKVAPNIVVTARAAEEVQRIIAEQQADGLKEKLYLRLRVVGGGCSGYQHKLDLDPVVSEKLDETFEITGIPVVVDKRSMLYLGGAVVEFHDDLNKRGFSVSNTQAKSTCGCGSSFSM